MTRFVTDPTRLRHLRAERFIPWPLPDLTGTGAIVSAGDPFDCRTWGGSCGRGWVRDERFGEGQVIKGTSRAKQRKDRK